MSGDVVAVMIDVGRDGCVYALEGFPPLNLGEDGLIFVKRAFQQQPVYVVVGGFAGAFRIIDGRLAAVSHAYPTSEAVDGKTVAQIRAMVERTEGSVELRPVARTGPSGTWVPIGTAHRTAPLLC